MYLTRPVEEGVEEGMSFPRERLGGIGKGRRSDMSSGKEDKETTKISRGRDGGDSQRKEERVLTAERIFVWGGKLYADELFH